MNKVAFIPVDSAKLSRAIVTEVAQAYAYKDGIRSEAPAGFRATAAFPAMQLEKADVLLPLEAKVDGIQPPVEVIFEGLSARLYNFEGKTGLKMTATGIRPAAATAAGK